MGQSVYLLATGWTVMGSNRGCRGGRGEIFRIRPDRSWGPCNPLYNIYRVWDRIPVVRGGGEIFRVRPDRPWGPCNPLYNIYRVWDRIPVVGEGVRFSASVQTGPGAHAAPCTIYTGSLAVRYSDRGVPLTTHRHITPRLKKEYSCSFTPPLILHDLL